MHSYLIIQIYKDYFKVREKHRKIKHMHKDIYTESGWLIPKFQNYRHTVVNTVKKVEDMSLNNCSHAISIAVIEWTRVIKIFF